MGPPATAIHGMGDKLESKRLAQKAGVHIVSLKYLLNNVLIVLKHDKKKYGLLYSANF